MEELGQSGSETQSARGGLGDETRRQQTLRLAKELRDDIAKHPNGPQLSRLLDRAVAGLEEGIDMPGLMRQGLYGMYSPAKGGIVKINGRGLLNKALTDAEIKGTMMHELTHAVDDIVMGGEKGAAALLDKGLMQEIATIVETGEIDDAVRMVYAATSEFEALAEIVTYDVLGVAPRTMTQSGLVSKAMSAADFAAKFPKLSGFARQWMQGVFE
jgi:hypothetical protein